MNQENRKRKEANPELRIKSWLEKHKEDLKAAKAMLDAHRYLWCAVICQQAIEKYLKAGYVKRYQQIPPYVHKLERLCEELELIIPEDSFRAMVDIDKYYITVRYPAYKESVNIKNFKRAENIYNKTLKIIKWLKEELKIQ